MKSIQGVSRVGYSGRPGSYSELAILKASPPIPKDVKILYYDDFCTLVDRVENGRLDLGMLPVYNTTFLFVGDNLELFYHRSLDVILQVTLPVHHSLLGRKGVTIEEIDAVHSHPQALGQTKEYRENMGILGVEVYDTAGFAEKLSLEGSLNQAAIAHERCADIYGLDVLDKGIQDKHDNATIFYLIARRGSVAPIENTEVVTAFMVEASDEQFPVELSRVITAVEREGGGMHFDHHKYKRGTPSSMWAYLYLDGDDSQAIERVLQTFLQYNMPGLKVGSFPHLDLRKNG